MVASPVYNEKARAASPTGSLGSLSPVLRSALRKTGADKRKDAESKRGVVEEPPVPVAAGFELVTSYYRGRTSAFLATVWRKV